MFMVVFALQEGQSHHWAPWVWGTLAGGIGVFAAFVFWQQANRNEPLVPLAIFRDRDFSLSALGIATIGFVATGMILPLMFYAQSVCGLSPTRSALLTAPMAIATGVLAPWVGRIVDRHHPRPIIGFGFSMLAIALTWLSVEMTPTTPIWRILLPLTATGIGMAFIWSPLAATATRNLASSVAGAGSGVYNATRQVGSVLGSASMAAFMTTRISAEMPLAADGPTGEGSATQLPSFLHEPFAAAMSQSLLLPAFIALFGVVAAMFLLGFGNADAPDVARAEAVDEYWDSDDDVDDDDDYVEFTVVHDDEPAPGAPSVAAAPAPFVDAPAWPMGDESYTQPIPKVVAPTAVDPPAEPMDPLGDRREPVRSLYDFLAEVPPPKPSVEPIGFAHNGFHTDDDEHFQPLSRFGADEAGFDAPPRHGLVDDDTPSNGRHSRTEPDDASSIGRHGRHSRPGD
jgi:Major Facilitator Superfamily